MIPINVAIVGCGRISDLHELGYRGRKDARILAVCDVKRSNAVEKAKAWGISRIYTDYQDVLDDPEIDMVELLVPHHLHCKMTVQACEAKKHVSVQKPMALNAAQADEMTAAAKRNNIQLRVYETFVFYPPAVKAKELIDEGAIGRPQMIRAHVNTGTQNTGWKVPLNSWFWRFNDELNGGGPLVFDHGYHLFSLIHHLMGPVERVYAWLDQSEYAPGIAIDAPANIMFQFKAPRKYGQLDFAYTPKMKIFSKYYTDDDRIEIIGDKGILFINRYTARTVDLPPLMLFRDGKTTTIPMKRAEWEHSFIDCTRHFIDILQKGGSPVLDGPTGKSVLQFTLAALISSKEGREVRPDDVK